MHNIEGSAQTTSKSIARVTVRNFDYDDRFINRISKWLVLALGAIFAMEVASFVIQNSQIKSEAQTFNTVSLSSNQRMLSQRVTALSLLLINSKSEETREKTKTAIASEIEALQANHERLILGDSEKGIPAHKSLAIHSIFFAEPTLLDSKVRRFLDSARSLLKSKGDSLNLPLEDLAAVANDLTRDFDQLTTQYRQEGISGMQDLQKLASNLMILQLLLVTSTALFIFYPLILRLKKEFYERAMAKAELVEQNEDLEHFASVVAHDLKAPLNNINGFCHLLTSRFAKDPQQSPEIDEILKMTGSGVRRMSKMIDEMLKYSKLTSKDRALEKVSLKEIVEKVLSDFSQKIAEESAQVTIKELPTILCDRVLMEHLFMNLIGNALKYRHRERSPRITIQTIEGYEPGKITFMVEDNGRGFPNGFEKWMFEPFSRLNAKDLVEGSGFGLALCRKIVLRHRGTIVAEHVESGGARFIVSLPTSQFGA